MNYVEILHVQDQPDLWPVLKQAGVDAEINEPMILAAVNYVVAIQNCDASSVKAIGRKMQYIGGGVWKIPSEQSGNSNAFKMVLTGNGQQFRFLAKKIRGHSQELDSICSEFEIMHETAFKQVDYQLNCPRVTLDLKEKTQVMGILNITPDSFSDGGLFYEPEKAIDRALEMAEEGADIIDIGGESTKPGSEEIPIKEEIRRVIPVIQGLQNKLKIPLSIDTRKSEVAEAAIQEGAQIVNDVSGLRYDHRMVSVVAEADVPVIIMHMKGTPKTMQVNPHYNHLMKEIFCFLASRVREVTNGGIRKEMVILDPGVGFGKSWENNFTILSQLNWLHALKCPLLIGVSRKSFIGRLLGVSESERIFGTAAAVAASIIRGVHLVRVHDVKEMIQVTRMIDHILRN